MSVPPRDPTTPAAAGPPPHLERPIEPVRGTRDWLPDEFGPLAELETLLLDRFGRAGYEPLRTSVLEPVELHERKSGAGIVSKLFELAAAGQGGVCLRPELTAGIVRAYTAAEVPPPLPWRVSHAGPVFRYEDPRPGRLREFQQVGVERLGDSGPLADGEAIWLAAWAAAEAGLRDTRIRIGHVGLILEMLERSGLPAPTRSALIEMLSEAASEGRGVRALEGGLERLSGWLQPGAEPSDVPGAVDRADDGGIDRLFRTLVPVITGRRPGHEIIHRLRRKWELGHGLHGALDRVRNQLHDLGALKGPPAEVLDRLAAGYEAAAPESVAALRALLRTLDDFGVEPGRVELDLGFGRGIGFYSQVVFEVVAMTPGGPVEVCGGGRYDGLARVLGSPRDDRGVGFAFGLERLWQALRAQSSERATIAPRGFLVLALSDEARPAAVRLATRLRAEGARAVLEEGRSFGEALESAEAAGVARLVVAGAESGDAGAEGLVLHDLVDLTEAPTDLGRLVRLARDEAGGRRR